jgi:DNA-binding NarL/FixJ family response regulator
MQTVLVVDDHEGFRTYARVFLGTQGFDVVGEAVDGAAALEASSRLNPDVVLLDVQLPDIDGFEVSRRLTAGRDAPIVVLVSTREADDYGARIRECGARAFLTKSKLTASAVREVLG